MNRRWDSLIRVCFWLALFLVVCSPEVAQACPVCFDSREENRTAFIATTAFLTFLPLGLIGAMVFTLFRLHAKAKRGDEEVDSQAKPLER